MIFHRKFIRLGAKLSILTLAGGVLGMSVTASAQEEAGIDEAEIEEIIVTGYQSQKKSDVTGAVSSINVDEATKFISNNPAIALAGQAAGVQVLTQGGIAGADAKILIRGTGTFGNTEPLYVIDGAFSSTGMSGLNPNDIQTIQVLKDGAAAAIYGSRAANGVVVITTKRGVSGEPKIEISSTVSIQTVAEDLSFANADQWRTYASQAAANDGNPPAPEDSNPNYSQGVDTDWQNLWFDDALMYQTNLSISGGSDSSDYRISLGYLNQEGMTQFSEFEKANARASLNFDSGKFGLRSNFGATYTDKQPTRFAAVHIPTAPVTDAEGNFVIAGGDFYLASSPQGNGYAQAAIANDRIEKLDLIGNLDLTYEFLDGLTYKLAFSANYVDDDNLSRDPVYHWAVIGDSSQSFEENTRPGIAESNGTTFNYTIDSLVYYDFDWGQHSFSTVVGYSKTEEDFRITGIDGSFDNIFEEQLTTINGDARVSGTEFESLLESWLASVNYNYDSRYLATVSVRQDKSSKFGPDNNEDTFPSISAGWNLHEESFFPEDGFVSSLKVKASYGELGANFIRPYQFTSLAYGPLPAIFGNSQVGPGDRSFGRVTQILDPNLRWETSESTNFAAEFGFLDDALSISAGYYNRTNKDILAPVPLPPSAGQQIFINDGESPDVNTAEIENSGFEFELDYNGSFKDVYYSISANLATLDNEVIALGENVVPIGGSLMSGNFDDRPTRTDAGGPLGAYWGYITQGLDANGNFVFKDTNGRDASGNLTGQPDGVVNDDDKVILGSPHPDYTYGLTFSGGYKDWDFSLLLEGSQGAEIFSQIKYRNYFLLNDNVVTDGLNAWTPSNTNGDIPRATVDNASGGNALPSDFYVEDGSYLRIRSLQVGYTMPDATARKWNLASLRVFLSAQNLHTWTDYSGYDPNVSSDALFNRGVDFRGYPNSRTYTLGVEANF